jgi:hypothetical protein
MPLRFGPGPVFIHESICSARRWQVHALRSVFALGLLLVLATVLYMEIGAPGSLAENFSIHEPAALGEDFYFAIDLKLCVVPPCSN